MRVMHII